MISFFRQDQKWANERVNCLPVFARSFFLARWKKLHDEDSTKRRNANLMLLKKAKRANAISSVIGFFKSDDDILLSADKVRSVVKSAIAAKMSAVDVDNLRFDLSSDSQKQRAVDSIYLCRKVRTQQKRNNERFARESGFVSAKTGLYVSDAAFNLFIAQQKKTEEMLKKAVLICDDEKISLLDVFNSSVSNPRIRRVEMMKRINAMQEIAREQNRCAVFVTMTCPSEFHAVLKAAGLNPAFDLDNSCVRKSQAWLCKRWQLIRAKLHRDNNDVYGFRVAEPHHDATAHWHMLIFVDKLKRQHLIDVLQKYMHSHCSNGAQKDAALKIVDIDETKGSAAAYVAKYVSKNIVGNDHAEDMSANNALRVRAWASLWGIRQFQFFGFDRRASVGNWRECRRVAQLLDLQEIASVDNRIAQMCESARDNDYLQFAAVAMSFGVVKSLAVERVNRFCETVKRKIGITVAGDTVVDLVTKIKQYSIKF